MPRVWVLYEDQSSKGNVKGFGLHALLLACLSDATGVDRWQLGRDVEPNLKNGNERLLDACIKDAPSLSRGGAKVVALVDTDRIRDMARLSECDTVEAAVASFQALCPHPNLLVLPLVQNVESVVQAAAACDHSLASAAGGGLRKRPDLRDKFFQRVAASTEAVRRCILERVPSFARLCEQVRQRLGLALKAPAAEQP